MITRVYRYRSNRLEVTSGQKKEKEKKERKCTRTVSRGPTDIGFEVR